MAEKYLEFVPHHRISFPERPFRSEHSYIISLWSEEEVVEEEIGDITFSKSQFAWLSSKGLEWLTSRRSNLLYNTVQQVINLIFVFHIDHRRFLAGSLEEPLWKDELTSLKIAFRFSGCFFQKIIEKLKICGLF